MYGSHVFIRGTNPLYAAPQGGALVDEALCGQQARVLGERCGWVQVETAYGYTGWSDPAALRSLAQAKAWGAAPKAVVQQAFADVLAQPKVQAARLLCLPRGSLVGLDGEPRDGWQPLRLPDGRQGWAPACFLDAPVQPHTRTQAQLRRQIIKAGLSYLGVQYRWGGKTPAGIDCSGLTQMAYLLCGIPIWRDAQIQPGFPVQEIPRAQLRPADLLYFPGHVALYLGRGVYLHATAHAGDACVTLNSLDSTADRFRADLALSLRAVGSVFP